MTVMTTLCTVGAAFTRDSWLVALCKECRHLRICYLLRLQPDSVEHVIQDAQEPFRLVRFGSIAY